ncbi:MAG: hypothetical protein WD469_07390 [Paenibacillaceae bacterium]
MLKRPILRKKDLTEFVMKRVREFAPAISFEQGEDALTFRLVEPNGDASGWLWLHNIWHDYQRSGDLNIVINFINGQIEAMLYMKQMTEQPRGVDIFNVYPAIRPQNYVNDQKEQIGRCFNDASVPGLDTVFVERKEGFLVILNEDVVKPVLVYMDENEIKKQAYENLRKRGWVEPEMIIPAMNVEEDGTFHVFHSPGYPFHHQFLLSDMSSVHLPNSFLVTFPGQYMAVVLTIEGSIQSALQAKRIAERSGLIYFAKYATASEHRPLSNNIYWVEGNKRYWLKGVKA